jgi:hypothetical protein
MWKQHPETRPSAHSEGRILLRDLEIMKARLESLRIDPDDKDSRWGAIAEDEIVAWQNFLVASGAIKKRLDPKIFYTNIFVDDYNRFDVERIKAQARNITIAK